MLASSPSLLPLLMPEEAPQGAVVHRTPKVGALCLARSDHDELYYRAQVFTRLIVSFITISHIFNPIVNVKLEFWLN